MQANLRLKEIKIKGFRGYGDSEETIDLSAPASLFVGNNRSGKSSTLNAIEWALYGSDITGKKSGINERKGWLTRNRNCDSVHVELVIDSEEGEVHVFRDLGGGRRGSGEKFFYVDENGEQIFDQESLWVRLGMEPKDFMSSVYLHQEVIREILVTEPRVRKNALDRLLGISDLRNLHDALKKIKRREYERKIDGLYEDLEERISQKAERFQEEQDEALERGEELGIGKKQFTENGLNGKCDSIVKMLNELAKKAKIKNQDLDASSGLKGFKEFSAKARHAISTIRSSNPAVGTQKDLISEKASLERALSEYQEAKSDEKALLERKKGLEKNGNLKDLKQQLAVIQQEEVQAKEEMEKKSSRINVINDTISYLEKIEKQNEKSICPACEQDIIPSQVLELLHERKEEEKETTGELGEKLEELDRQRTSMESQARKLEKLVNKEIPEAREETGRAIKRLEEILKTTIAKEEDPEKKVNDRLGAIEKNLDDVKSTLEKYSKAISDVEDELEVVELIEKYLTAKERVGRIEKVKKAKEWESLNKARDEFYIELDRIETVADAVEETLKETSGKKLEDAKENIVAIYRNLVNRPDFDEIEIDPEKDYDVFAVKRDERERVITFFNQGDMNCVALAVFLALGGGNKDMPGPEFLILDDPSQSLDSVQKARLAGVVGDISENTQVLLATMDEELMDEMKKSISKKKRVYRFGEWEPAKGPSVSEE